MAAAFTLILVASLFVANGFVTYRLLKSESYEAIQKGFQVAIIWLLPVIGAYVVWQFLRPATASNLPTAEHNDEALADTVYLERSIDSHVNHEINGHD